MAVKSSGQLSLRYDILAEVGGASYVNLSLRNMSSRVGFSTPDAMSEFYGYSSNTWAIAATGNGYLRTQEVSPPDPGGDRYSWTLGLWFNNTAPSKRNQNLIAVGDGIYYRPSGRFIGAQDWILVRYLASLNRIIVEVYNGGVRRLKRDYPLHDYPNVSITGVSNSSTGWRYNTGNRHSSGFTHLVVTVSLTTTTATNAIKTYWNGQELTYSVSNVNSGVFPVSNINGPYASVGESLHQAVPSAGSWYGEIDNAFIMPVGLSSGTISTLYSNGQVSPESYFRNNSLSFFAVWDFENDTFNSDYSMLPAPGYRLARGGTTSFVT